jgi:hypothetical protein
MDVRENETPWFLVCMPMQDCDRLPNLHPSFSNEVWRPHSAVLHIAQIFLSLFSSLFFPFLSFAFFGASTELIRLSPRVMRLHWRIDSHRRIPRGPYPALKGAL